MASSNYSYGPGSMTLQTQSGGGGFPGGDLYAFAREMAQRAMYEHDQDRAEQMRLRNKAISDAHNAYQNGSREPMAGLPKGQASMSPERQAPQPGSGTPEGMTPFFTNYVSGPGIVPGAQSSNTFSPGMVFGGYRPRGRG